MGAVVNGERTIATVVHDVVGNLGRIVRAEVRLAKVEVAEEMAMAVQAAGASAKLLVAGAAIGQLALGFLLLSFVRILETFFNLSPWLAALTIGLGTAALAIVLLATGLSQLKRVNLLPQNTLKSPAENIR